MKITLQSIISFIIDTIAPPDPVVRDIESLDIEGFTRHAGKDIHTNPAGIISLFPYRTDIMKAALIELKTHKNKKVADIVGGVLYQAMVESCIEISDLPAIVVPIPISKERRRERGWNQCDLILDGVHRADHNGMFECRSDVLIKTRDTGDQVGRSRQERLDAVRGVFAVPDHSHIAGRNVIVFDDILTTGSTLGEARHALIDARARSVVCYAVAR